MLIKFFPFLFLVATILEKGDSNKIEIEDPLPYMKVGNKWVYVIDFTGSRDTVTSILDTMTFEIESEVNNVFKVIQHQHGASNTSILYWYVQDGFLKSFYQCHQTMKSGQWLTLAHPSIGDKYYHAGDKGRYSLNPVKDKRLTTLEIVRTNQTVEIAGRTFSDVFTIEQTSSGDTTKYYRLYSKSFGFLLSDGLDAQTLIDINF